MFGDEGTIDAIAGRLRAAESVLWITGAGVSADSGLPTYRGIGGLYEEDDTIEGMPIEVALSGEVMAENPALTWRYIAQVERACRGAEPNRAHFVIAASEQRFDRVWTLTQNVDGLHRKAGSRNLIEIHGDLYDLYCTRCRRRERRATFEGLPIPPTCPDCGGPVRPDVVLFGEMLPEGKVAALYDQMKRGFDVIFSVGTTSVFPYISEPVIRGRLAGALTVEINPGSSEVSRIVDVKLRAGAADALDALWAHLADG